MLTPSGARRCVFAPGSNSTVNQSQRSQKMGVKIQGVSGAGNLALLDKQLFNYHFEEIPSDFNVLLIVG